MLGNHHCEGCEYHKYCNSHAAAAAASASGGDASAAAAAASSGKANVTVHSLALCPAVVQLSRSAVICMVLWHNLHSMLAKQAFAGMQVDAMMAGSHQKLALQPLQHLADHKNNTGRDLTGLIQHWCSREIPFCVYLRGSTRIVLSKQLMRSPLCYHTVWTLCWCSRFA